MVTVTVKQAEKQISSLLEQVADGEDVIITKDNAPVARIVSVKPESTSPHVGKKPQPGNAQDDLMYMADDFDARLTSLDLDKRNATLRRMLNGGVGANLTDDEIREFIDEGRP